MYTFADVDIFTGTYSHVKAAIATWIRQKKHAYVCVTGVHGLSESLGDSRVLAAFHKANLVVPDGMPLVWLGRRMGHPETQRIYGPDLMAAICRLAARRQWKIFLFGTTKSTLRLLQKNLREMYPHIHIAGFYAPSQYPFTHKEQRAIVSAINRSGAAIVFVGLGTPKQELWMAEVSQNLSANVLIGVGAAFDFIAGTKQQAPSWMRYSGLEWWYRLYQEPGRLWYRYVRACAIVGPRILFRLLLGRK
jgi:N-acetylglucosaminyldiphosphoundecaprenol N-acetyl-beta-D-mannosaminyltransferase